MHIEPYTVTNTDLLMLANAKDIGERLKFFREKANELNPPHFTVPNLAEKARVSKTTIMRIEEGDLKDPKSQVLYKIAKAIELPMEVFQDGYYEDVPQPFTICGYHNPIRDSRTMNPAYNAHITLSVETGLGTEETIINEYFSFSPLEYEELKEDAELLIEKMKRRKSRWSKKQNALSSLTDKKMKE